jgi:pimeloyl-ACP methyl ester carboxylesterase
LSPMPEERVRMTARPLVLVPGACLGGWAWRDVAARLRALGHDVFPVTLTGLGERVHLASRSVDLETHIADVLAVLDYEDLREAILVGHSYAGVVVTGAADRRPERLSAVVYLDCSPLPDGMSIADVQNPEQRELQRAAVEQDGGGNLEDAAADRVTEDVEGVHGRTLQARTYISQRFSWAPSLARFV